jgi:predicted MFS family arabinose efflux permease
MSDRKNDHLDALRQHENEKSSGIGAALVLGVPIGFLIGVAVGGVAGFVLFFLVTAGFTFFGEYVSRKAREKKRRNSQ